MLHRPNKTRGAKEGVIEPSAADLILPFVADLNEPPRYALHFGNVDKVGVNPKSIYSTPLAVCAYPLTAKIFKQFIDVRLPFAQRGAKYLFVLEIKPDARVFYSTERFFDLGVGPEYINVDLRKNHYDDDDYEMDSGDTRERGFYESESSNFFHSTRPLEYETKPEYFSEGGTVARSAQWGRKLWDMGIDVWVDADDEGILHGNEPSQVMFFNPRSYRVVLAMDNPKSTFAAVFGRDWRRLEGIDLTKLNVDFVNVYTGGAESLLSHEILTGLKMKGVIMAGMNLSGLDFSRSKLIDANLTGANLTGANLTDANLTDANLTRANLKDTELIDAKLIGAKLIGAYLRGADLSGADLSGADLSGVDLRYVQYDDSTTWPKTFVDVVRVRQRNKDLRGAVLRGATLPDADLSGADLTGADLTGAKLLYADLTGATLTDADLTGAELYGADLTGAKLYGAKLYGAELQDVRYDDSTIWPEDVRDVLRVWRRNKDLRGANLKGANLKGANLKGADLTGADLDYADLSGADLTDAKLNRVRLRYIQHDNRTIWPESARDVMRVWGGHKQLGLLDLSGEDLSGADLSDRSLANTKLIKTILKDAKFIDADLRWAEMHGANLTGADLIHADLRRAELHGANLTRADLSRADLRRADLTGADLSSAILDGIIYDDSTVWPDGFIPPPSAPRPNRR